MIIKNIPNEPLSLLLLQRAYNPKDIYSGQLCFPGGHREEGESSKETVIRETQEETGIDLVAKGNYLGMLDLPFFTKIGNNSKAKNRKDFSDVLIYEITEDVPIFLNFSEICDFQWIPLKLFFSEN